MTKDSTKQKKEFKIRRTPIGFVVLLDGRQVGDRFAKYKQARQYIKHCDQMVVK